MLWGGLKWNPWSIACVMDNSVVVQQDQDVVSKELHLVCRGHKVSNTAQFIHYATINNTLGSIVIQKQNNLVSHTNFHVKDKYVLTVPCDHAHMHDYLLPFFSDNKFITHSSRFYHQKRFCSCKRDQQYC